MTFLAGFRLIPPLMRVALGVTSASLLPLTARADLPAKEPPNVPVSASATAREGGGTTDPPETPAPRHAVTLDFVGHLGWSYRLGSPPALEVMERSGLAVGGGLVFTPVRAFALGLDYEHIDLGRERLDTSAVDPISTTREMHSLWADLRVTPLRTSALSIFVDLSLGLAWQSAEASTVVYPRDFQTPPTIVTCKASDASRIALRAGAGVLVPLDGGLLFMSNAAVENARLGGELLDDCALGAGGTSALVLRAGLAYRLDLTHLFH